MLKTTVTGIRKMNDVVDAHDRKAQSALKTAIKIEGFRRLRQLREEIRAGNPGGRPYIAELSRIASRTKTGRLKKNRIPLYRLARLLRYNVEYVAGDDIRLSFGFVNTNKQQLGRSWKKLLLSHEEGVGVLYTGSRTELGRRLARIGGRLKKQDDPDAKFFFLKRTTGRRINLPQRGMIDPFWKENENDAWKNIRKNFRRKMRGERI